MEGGVISFRDVEAVGDEVDLLVLEEMTAFRMIDTTVWMVVDAHVGEGDALITTEEMEIGVEAGVTVPALKGFERGVIAEVEAEAGAVVAAGAGVEVEAGLAAAVEAGLVAGVPDVAVAAAMTDMRGRVSGMLTGSHYLMMLLLLNQRCHLVSKRSHFLNRSSLDRCQQLRIMLVS